MDNTETSPSEFPTPTPILLNLLGLMHGQGLGLFEPWNLDQLRKRKCWKRIIVASNRMGVKICESSRERRVTLSLSWPGLFHIANVYTALVYSSAWNPTGEGRVQGYKKPHRGGKDRATKATMTPWQQKCNIVPASENRMGRGWKKVGREGGHEQIWKRKWESNNAGDHFFFFLDPRNKGPSVRTNRSGAATQLCRKRFFSWFYGSK